MSKNNSSIKAPSTFGYRLMWPLLVPLFKLWYNPKVIGKEKIPKKGALVVASNHLHVYDQCLAIIATRRPINYMAKNEYFEGKLKGFFKFAGCIPVMRNGKDDRAVRTALKVLKNKGAIGIFPEGTRNKTEQFLLPFKFGAVSMADKTNAMILPVGVSGDFKFRSKNLVVRFGEPFAVGDMTLPEANDKLRDEIAKLVLANLGLENESQFKKKIG